VKSASNMIMKMRYYVGGDNKPFLASGGILSAIKCYGAASHLEFLYEMKNAAHHTFFFFFSNTSYLTSLNSL